MNTAQCDFTLLHFIFPYGILVIFTAAKASINGIMLMLMDTFYFLSFFLKHASISIFDEKRNYFIFL